MTTVSVVMAVHDGAAYIAESIDSVLNQSFSDFEFIIVDDASIDGTPDLLEEYRTRDGRLRVLRNPTHVGPYPSVNRAIREARCDLIARQDSDDVSPPTRLVVQLEALRSQPDVSLVTGAIERFRSGDNATIDIIRPPSSQPQLEWELLFANVIGGAGHTMFPRVIRGQAILFPERRRFAEDYALCCQLARLGTVVCPTEIVYRYRQHSGSITARRRIEQDACAAEVRYESHTQFIDARLPLALSRAVSQFWRLDGGSKLEAPAAEIVQAFTALRDGFLRYIEQRYGARVRTGLDADISAQLDERLAYWLYRSATFLDFRAFQGLVATAAHRRAFRIGVETLRLGAGGLHRKLTRETLDS